MKLKKKNKWGKKSKRSLRDGVKRNGKINTVELSSKRFFTQNYCGGGGGGVNELKVLEPHY